MEQFSKSVGFGEQWATASGFVGMAGSAGDTSPSASTIPYVPPLPPVPNACIATKADGKPCRGAKLPNREVCVGHSNTLIKLGLDPDTTTEWPS